jgi:hypothetical protein
MILTGRKIYSFLGIKYATHEKVGDVEIFSVFGMAVYERVGRVSRLIGFCYANS